MAHSVLFLTKYTALAASTRQRVLQYLDAVRAAGFAPTVQPLFSDRYLRQSFARVHSWRRSAEVLRCLLRRWRLLMCEIEHYNLVFVQYEALPYLPLWFSRNLLRADVRLVTDYDDAIHLNYEQHLLRPLGHWLRGNIPTLIAHSRQVIVGNRRLAEWAQQSNAHVTLIPTAVDLYKYADAPTTAAHSPIVIGWIGTPSTANYLRMLELPLRALRQRHAFTLKVIGAPDFQMGGVDVCAHGWDESRESADLRSFDIGIMPVRDDEWGRGKSAFKLIQYLAAGVPAVASAVGANCDVVQDNVNGFLAVSDDEWLSKLSLLIEQPTLRARFAAAGRPLIEQQYSLQANAPRFVRVLEQALES